MAQNEPPLCGFLQCVQYHFRVFLAALRKEKTEAPAITKTAPKSKRRKSMMFYAKWCRNPLIHNAFAASIKVYG